MSSPVLADCASPSGFESQTRFAGNILYYCDGTTWQRMDSAGGGSGLGCIIGDKAVPHNGSATFYSATSGDCPSISEVRTCTNGVLSGSFAHASCTLPPCAGVWLNGYCWYKSGSNKHCDDACSTHGGCNLAGTRDYAGSAGTNAHCLSVLTALGGTGSGAVSDQSFVFGTGCAWDGSDQRFRATSPVTNCTGYAMNTYRACACNN